MHRRDLYNRPAMAETITVNKETLQWEPGMNLFKVFGAIGYTLKVPVVLVRVNGESVVKSRWKEYEIPLGAEILIKNVFCGG